MKPIEIEFVIEYELGLHMRPATLFARVLTPFESDVIVSNDGKKADARSMLQLLSLAAPKGTPLAVSAVGPDAGEAMRAIEDLFANNFALDIDSAVDQETQLAAPDSRDPQD